MVKSLLEFISKFAKIFLFSKLLLTEKKEYLIINIIMQKFFKTAIVASAILAFGATVGAAAFNTNLTVGSTGADVSALQSFLISKGFAIPAISSGAAAPGYFGSQTKSAVVAYQASVNLPNTGFVGPLTRGILNGAGVAVTPAAITCPVGYTCTANPGTVVVPVTPVGPIVMDGTDGSLSVTTSSFVSTGATLKKGETKDVVAVKLQATSGSVSVTRVDAHFSVRPWLFFSQVTLKDSSGKVIATKAITGPSDSTEITVGSDYLIRFDGINYSVNTASNPDLVVGVTVLAATDKITNGMTVYAGIPSGAIRTVNGKGYTDSIGGANAFTGTSVPSGAGQTSFTLSSTGSVADISTRISPTSSATQVTVPVSATNATNNVALGWFSLKSANNSSTVNSLNVQVTATVGSSAAINETTVLSNVRLMIGSQSYGALSFSDTGLATFTNLSVPLTQDLWTDVKVVADVVATSTDVTVSSLLDASTINAIDSTYTAATIGGSAMASATNDQTSINTLLTINSVSLTLGATPAVITQEIKIGGTGANAGKTSSAAVAYTFTLTNNSSNSMYVPSVVGTFINGTTTVPASIASTTFTAIDPVVAVAGDGSGYYILPSSGGSRTFTVTGMLNTPTGATGTAEVRLNITSIAYGATTAGTGSSITTGLTTLTKSILLTPAL